MRDLARRLGRFGAWTAVAVTIFIVGFEFSITRTPDWGTTIGITICFLGSAGRVCLGRTVRRHRKLHPGATRLEVLAKNDTPKEENPETHETRRKNPPVRIQESVLGVSDVSVVFFGGALLSHFSLPPRQGAGNH